MKLIVFTFLTGINLYIGIACNSWFGYFVAGMCAITVIIEIVKMFEKSAK